MSETPKDMLRVTIADGKYTVVQDASGRLTALRYGEPWRDCVGDGLIYRLAAEVDYLRQQLAEQRNKVLEEACKLIQKRADDYDAENGWTDMETGTREYPKGGDDYMLELTEIIELVATLRTTQPAKERTEK